MAEFNVYGIFDPRDGQLRYVGCHVGRIQKRLNEHLCKARRGVNLYVYDWMRQVLASGAAPEIETLETCEDAETMLEAEIWHISYWSGLGCRLTNLTTGGEGCFGYRHTPASRAKISAAKKGRPRTEAWKQSRRKLTRAKEREVALAYATGLSCEAVGQRFGLTGGGIRKVLIRAGVVLRNPAEQRWTSARLAS